jgi:signal peptidase I
MLKKKRRDWVVYPLFLLGLPLVIGLTFVGITSAAYNIPAGSMRPGLIVGDHVLAWRNHYKEHAPERGEIAIFLRRDEDVYIKRVIGVPGDTIQMKAGRLWINGAEIERQEEGTIEDDYGGTLMRYREILPNGVGYSIIEKDDAGPYDQTEPFQVPEGSYFVMGDNRDNSNDSRVPEFGPVKADRFLAKPYLIYYSPSLDRIGTRIN